MERTTERHTRASWSAVAAAIIMFTCRDLHAQEPVETWGLGHGLCYGHSPDRMRGPLAHAELVKAPLALVPRQLVGSSGAPSVGQYPADPDPDPDPACRGTRAPSCTLWCSSEGHAWRDLKGRQVCDTFAGNLAAALAPE